MTRCSRTTILPLLCLKRNLRGSVKKHSTKIEVDHHRVIGIPSSKRSSGENCIFPLTTDAMLAFSHPFAIWRFPWQLVRWLNKFMSQVAFKGLIRENLRSTSISSLVTPDYIWVWISLVYQLVNWLNYKQKKAVNQKKSVRCNKDRKDVLKKNPDSEHFKNCYCFVFEIGIKFRNVLFSH